MKLQAISLWQPWASLIAIGAKTIETRHWTPPLELLVKNDGRIAIHAALKNDGEIRALLHTEPFKSDLAAAGRYDPATNTHSLPLGKIVAVARLTACHSTNDRGFLKSLSERERAYGNYGPNRYGWVLKDIQALIEPLPWRGAQGFFGVEIPPEAQFRKPVAVK